MTNQCINCKHRNGHMCTRPDERTGLPINTMLIIERKFEEPDTCGPEGKFFEQRTAQKLTTWQKIKQGLYNAFHP